MPAAELQREEVRNRLLRRVDWRFLLPDPHPERSVCFASGGLAEAVEAISGELLDPVTAGIAGDCDLAVVLDPTSATLREAWAALRPGGSCYAEWHTLPGRGPAGTRRRLQAAGFENVVCYGPRPNPARKVARVWVPLDSTAAVRHFVHSGPSPRSALRRAGRTLRRALWLSHPGARVALPICAIARKPTVDLAQHAPTNDPAPEGLLDMIRSQWSAWGLGEHPEDLGLLLLTGGQRSINKVVALACASSTDAPQVAVKISRTPEAATGLANEARVLAALDDRARGLHIPRLLWCEQRGGLVRLAETALMGQPLLGKLREDSYRELARRATDWQIRLAGAARVQPPRAWRSRLVEPVLAEFTATYGPVIDSILLREAERVLDSLGPLPLVCEQRDFAPWNLLLAPDGELVVLDWESAELEGLPALDLVYFLTYAGFFLDDAFTSRSYGASYRGTFDPATFTGAVASDCLARYLEAVGVGTEALHPLRVLCWMLHARSEYAQFTGDAGGRPTPEVLRRGVFVRLWEEELRHGA
ncbi:MAG: aminoglycoside phosphotransferase family protein [Gemmatimonadetes bacterium]|nr:aminoglycoside phosphotransferase family protein [Gemmatimonadota bacterium]